MDAIYSERNSLYQFTFTLNFLLLNFSLFSLATSEVLLGFLWHFLWLLLWVFFVVVILGVFYFPYLFLLHANTDNHPVGQLSSLLQQTFLFLSKKYHFSSDIILVTLLSFNELHRDNSLQVYCILASWMCSCIPTERISKWV